jgi:hypothetical protein
MRLWVGICLIASALDGQLIKVWITTFPKNKPRKIIIRNALACERHLLLALGQSSSGLVGCRQYPKPRNLRA